MRLLTKPSINRSFQIVYRYLQKAQIIIINTMIKQILQFSTNENYTAINNNRQSIIIDINNRP